MPLRSRQFAFVALIALVVLAGCGALPITQEQPDEPDQREHPPVFGSVEVINEDNRSYAVDVVILHDDSVVYWTTRQVEDREGNVLHEATVDPSAVENTTREYTVLIRLNNSTEGVRYQLDVPLPDCYSVGASVQDGELVGPRLLIWHDDVHDHCAEPWNRTTATDGGA